MIALGCDHGGYDLMQEVIAYLDGKGIAYKNFGCYSSKESVDYPDVYKRQVLNIAQYMAFRSDVTVAIFSLEMSKEQLVNRLLSMESGVDAQKLRNGNLTDSDWERLVEGAEGVASSHLIIDDTPGITLAELRSKCRKYKLENHLGIVMIDYLQLM